MVDLAEMGDVMVVATVPLPRRPTATEAAEMAVTATAQAPTLTAVAAASTAATAVVVAVAAASTTPGVVLHQGVGRPVVAEGLISQVSPRASLATWGAGRATPHHLPQGPSLSWHSSSLPLSQ